MSAAADHSGPWTRDDVLALPDDARNRIELVEIASPSTRVTDRKTKPALYAAAGIPHYWRLELEPAPRLYLGALERGGYADRLVQAGERTALAKPFPFGIDPAQLLKG